MTTTILETMMTVLETMDDDDDDDDEEGGDGRRMRGQEECSRLRRETERERVEREERGKAQEKTASELREKLRGEGETAVRATATAERYKAEVRERRDFR